MSITHHHPREISTAADHAPLPNRRSVRILKETSSPSRKFFYVLLLRLYPVLLPTNANFLFFLPQALVWLVAIINLARSIFEIVSENLGAHGINPKSHAHQWPDTEDIVFLVLNMISSCLMWTLETIVLIFLLHGHIYVWRILVRRVALISGVLASAFTIIQVQITRCYA